MPSREELLVGAHLSTSRGGLVGAAQRALAMQSRVFQYFPKNPRSYRPKEIDRAVCERQREQVRELGVLTVAHSPYVTNLSTQEPALAELTRDSILNDLEICEAYGTEYLVVHCGRAVGAGPEAGRQAMVQQVREILQRWNGRCQLLLENTAGQGTELGQSLAELAELMDEIGSDPRLGLCFDTCHAFAAGVLDFDHLGQFWAEWDCYDMGERVRVVHLNDSKFGPGSRKDRHELLGQGQIGAEHLARLLADSRLHPYPLLIETPVAKEEEYAGEIERAYTWATGVYSSETGDW